ncbi:MAG: RNA methyltransferase [bacterium]|nr:RNA methyltransferase [bacterium]MDD3625632.1 RNA methyltransferase [Proteiniphilum sp.]MDD3969062.1 RNA methyltransferase [Proteiniphilum sp.]MDD4460254.1 RNA methyltransferase [Proteiniphilum sp.]
MSLSKNRIKYIRSLKEKKFRNEHRTFVAEGAKLVSDLLATCRCQFLAALPEILAAYPGMKADEMVAASEGELAKATFLKTAPQVIAVFYQPDLADKPLPLHGRLTLALDGVQDPGNVGTIIRIADWFGIDQILCSPETADIYNPKTVQASMGAIARVRTFYGQLPSLLSGQGDLPLYGTFLEGASIYSEPLTTEGVIVLGSEGKGISEATERLINRRLFIPGHPAGEVASESLNVAAAAAVVCAFFRRTKA